jgi:hypothetical protein
MNNAIQVQYKISGSHGLDYEDYFILECVTGFFLKVQEERSSIMSITCMTLPVCENKNVVE